MDFNASLESNKYMANRVRPHFDLFPKEVRTDLWLSSTFDAEKSVRLYVGFLMSQEATSYKYIMDLVMVIW